MQRRWPLLLLLLAAACGPIGPLPGGRLGGEIVEGAVTDWSFTNEFDNIAVETRPDDPYSVTTWCFTHGGYLYVPSREPRDKKWVAYIADDDRVRLKIGERIYPRRAVRVTDEAVIEAIVPAVIEKYELELPSEDERPEVWFFRMDPR